MDIYYNDFADLNDYLNKNALIQDHFYLNKNTVRRCALTAGKYPWKKPIKWEILRWKLSLVDAFIDFGSGSSVIGLKDTDFLEESEQRIVSFSIGMIFAQCYAQYWYGVRHLHHLKNLIKDKTIIVSTKGKFPDFWAVESTSGTGYLIEAKGSCTKSNFIANQKIKEAFDQLSSVRCVVGRQVAGGHVKDTLYYGHNLKKYVIATHPDSKNELTQQVVDPVVENNMNILIDIDKATYRYYENLYLILVQLNKRLINIEGLDFYIIDIPEFNCSLGLQKEIYEIINSYYREEQNKIDYAELHEKINSILPKININNNNNNISIGPDGLISMDLDLSIMKG
ncbi:hypothetical protein A8F94_14435 [Bacillus sp. FJAT-27225]|uniref:hypothetical protein n=1 Tax=Bacillus sp. FJAT-27225 TaxID=1743144 RepID=UPI00080C2ECA|nr:hypothetical protein [Bacillus sp. FJAT-27225]OCA86037.1 hypothetical protein A8F94_14435 [Bacillus sp. FJAT-27225]